MTEPVASADLVEHLLKYSVEAGRLRAEVRASLELVHRRQADDL